MIYKDNGPSTTYSWFTYERKIIKYPWFYRHRSQRVIFSGREQLNLKREKDYKWRKTRGMLFVIKLKNTDEKHKFESNFHNLFITVCCYAAPCCKTDTLYFIKNSKTTVFWKYQDHVIFAITTVSAAFLLNFSHKSQRPIDVTSN